jgi:uncharacterized protein with von Willebrand factor type A (vWA) domain
MQARIIHFISALRAAGVRVSLAESADAFFAIEQLGIQDRETFRTSLRATLVKHHEYLDVFDQLFPLFFDSPDPQSLSDVGADLTPEEARRLADALRQFSEQVREMLERLLQGDQLQPDELDRLSRFVGLSRLEDLRYRDWMAQRMQRALRFPEVRLALEQLAEMLTELGMDVQRAEQLRQMMAANQRALEEQINQYAGQRIASNMSQRAEDGSLDDLISRPFNSLSDHEMERLRREVQRLAAVLRTRVALRQKKAKTGQLDAKATIRANLIHGSVPILLKHRKRSLKPKLVVICDISTSMRYCSELMLSLIFALQDQISRTHAFAFIDHLEDISPDFEGRQAREAVRRVLERMPSGYYNTDLGYSLANFYADYLDLVDGRTTLLMVGDGRNNYSDPRADLFRLLARRSRQMIWINPETPHQWGSGDSDMLKYAPSCSVVLQADSLSGLMAAVDKLLG